MRIKIRNSWVSVDSYTDLLWHLSDVAKSDILSPPLAPMSGMIEVKDHAPRLFALVIGINKYKSRSVTTLKGSVPDADDMNIYLKETLKVPADQICILRDKEATRSAIIQAFTDLRNDSRIGYGDAIVIFYAGHGGETTAPAGWDAENNKTQYILPHDIHKVVNGEKIFGIPDRTIATLINKLAKAKGDNISVIFDCCHSASGTRTDAIDPTRLARAVELEDNVPPDLDRAIWSDREGRGVTFLPRREKEGLLSHVLLAACGSKELAMEDNKRGVFTKTLLQTLRAQGADKVTYEELLNRIQALPLQNPQCVGVNKTRILFNARVPSAGRVFYKVSMVGRGYVMEAGAAHGITGGAEFTIYKERESPIKSSPLGKLVAGDNTPFTTMLYPLSAAHQPSFTGGAYAIQTKAGAKEDLRLHVAWNEKLLEVFKALVQYMSRPDLQDGRIQLVELNRNPHLEIDINKRKVGFKSHDSLVTKYALTRMPYTVNNTVDDVYPVICAAAHFRRHVDLTNPKHTLQNEVELQIFEVCQKEDEFDSDFNPVYEIVGKNLNIAGEVYIDEDPSKMYAFKIVNKTPLELYPSLFYFDNSTFEIVSFYQPPAAGQFKADPPLQKKSSITIGSGVQVPHVFSLPPGQNVDVGFLKLFLTTDNVDYSHIPQPSPFSKNRYAKDAKPKPIHIWDTIKVAFVQKKGLRT